MYSFNGNLHKILHGGNDSTELFDRLALEYRASGDAGKHELFMAVAAELATAQAVVKALARRGDLQKEAVRVAEAVESAERDIARGARRTDHRFSL